MLSSREIIHHLKHEKYCQRYLHDTKEFHIEAMNFSFQMRLFRMQG
jgi:hypothetical protein